MNLIVLHLSHRFDLAHFLISLGNDFLATLMWSLCFIVAVGHCKVLALWQWFSRNEQFGESSPSARLTNFLHADTSQSDV